MTWADSLADVSRDDWSRLVGTNALASWGWLRTVEETASEPWLLRYLLLREGDQLSAAAVCQIQPSSRDDRMDALVFGRARAGAWRLGLSMAPALICGPCGTYGSHLLVHDEICPDARARMERYLLDGLQARAHELRLPLAFVHVLSSQQTLMAQLDARGFARTDLSPMAQLDIEWSSFDGYERHVRKVSRNAFEAMRKERRRNAREGVSIEQLHDVAAYSPRLIDLLNMTTHKHSRVPFWYRDSYFSKLKDYMGENAVVYGAWKGDLLVGACVMLRSATDGYLTEIGIDHERAGNDFTYFNIGYYRPIEDAIASGLKRLHFDNALHELKVRRGCRLVDDYLYYKSDTRHHQLAVRSLFWTHSRWFRRKHAYLDRLTQA